MLFRWFKCGLAGKQRDTEDNLSMSSSIQTRFTELFTLSRSVVSVNKPGTPVDHEASFTYAQYEAMQKWPF